MFATFSSRAVEIVRTNHLHRPILTRVQLTMADGTETTKRDFARTGKYRFEECPLQSRRPLVRSRRGEVGSDTHFREHRLESS
ncbi:hypothetical protein Bca52824_081560 [Brassica carinata]|uniref:Uncharacterized protein n=1 Tax=Brassica carinata TaxID=52824 RepID=A0A8X7PKR8_BRACI|nr:hypothetical protein Bca52824_081560 [Brassica carinata]